MKEFLKSPKLKILLCILLALILPAVFTSRAEGNPFSSAVGWLTSGLSRVTAAATDSKKSMSYDELLSEYEKLKEENKDLRAELTDYYDTKYENARLLKFYDLKKENPDYKLVPAVALRRDPNDEFASFTLDKGTSSSVEEGDPVVTENGLIGWVSSADYNTCKVVTVLSPQTSVGAIDNRTQDAGVISGSASLFDKNETMLSKLSSSHKIEKGDVITTTGSGGIYPKGLIIGEVTELGYDTYDTSYYAVVRPYDDIKTLREAAIITDFSGQGEILGSMNDD